MFNFLKNFNLIFIEDVPTINFSIYIVKRKIGKNGWDVYIQGGRINTGIDVLEWAYKNKIDPQLLKLGKII